MSLVSETSNNYYLVHIHGRPVTVYCVMGSDPRSYIDINATVTARNINYKYWRVLLEYDDCLIRIQVKDFEFSDVKGITPPAGADKYYG